jgi:hypothetical protein
MFSKIFTIFLVAGISILAVSLYLQPTEGTVSYDALLKSQKLTAHVAVIPSKPFADYLPYIGGISAAVGLGEKFLKFFMWFIHRKK